MVDSIASDRDRWDVWMVQAQRFARRENFIDALGRTRLVLDELEGVLATLEGAERSKLERYHARVVRRRDAIQTAFDSWNAKIAARRQAASDNADAEMARPLPLGPGQIV